jgi:7-carboxy-7-deazaguanine synthase
MSLILIQANPTEKRPITSEMLSSNDYLAVAEMFSHTIQGEGVSVGIQSTFLRMQHCTLSCVWCDTTSVWKQGNLYHKKEILDMWELNKVVERFYNGEHLVLTGGSPLLQQDSLEELIISFKNRFGFIPFIEVENEVVRQPSSFLCSVVEQWNNSPKLANSGMRTPLRYKPSLIKFMGELHNSWFKFVVDCDEDWNEIQTSFLDNELIKKSQIIIMPRGENQKELLESRPIAVEMAIKYNVRFSDRLHITLWDKKTGV